MQKQSAQEPLSTRVQGIVMALAVYTVIIGIPVAVLFFTAKTVVENKENLVWALTHKELMTSTREVYEGYGQKGLEYGLGSAKDLIDEVAK